MPELPLVQPGEIIEADYTNDVARRTVQRYASVVDRSTENPTPEQGDVSYLLDTNLVEWFNGASWTSVFLPLTGGIMKGSISLDAPDVYSLGSSTNFYNTVYASRVRGTVIRELDGTNAINFSPGLRDYYSPDGTITMRINDGAVEFQGNDLTGVKTLLALDGSLGVPSISFSNSNTTGIFLAANNNMQLIAGGVSQIAVRADRINFNTVYADTTASTANMVVQTDGRIQRNTSARKYKSNIQPAPQLAALTLDPVTFHHDGDDTDYIGFIADDMPIEEAIIRDGDEVENYDLRAVVAILAAKVNELTGRLEALEG